jgi:hypothetical protein
MTQHQEHNRKSHHLELKGLCKISLKIEHENKKTKQNSQTFRIKNSISNKFPFWCFFQHIWTLSSIWYIFSIGLFYYLNGF